MNIWKISVYSTILAASLIAIPADESPDAQAPQKGKPAKEQRDQKGAKRPAPTAEQRAARKELLSKYDTNKDGKLDQNERKNISAEDKAKMKQSGPANKRKPAKTN